MIYLNASEMLSEPLDIRNVSAHAVREPRGYSLSFSGQKRSTCVLFFYHLGRRAYTSFDDGQSFTLQSGDILFIPQYAHYQFCITDTGDEQADYGIALNFSLLRPDGEPVSFGRCPRVIAHDRLAHYFSLFHRLENIGHGAVTNGMLLKAGLYSLLYELLCEARSTEVQQTRYAPIAQAINLIEADPARDIPVPALAKLCGVSETSFRCMFRQYSGGVSPVEYRNRLRIDKAETLLRTERVTVEYAALTVGFRDLSFFYRTYRRYKQSTPLCGKSLPAPDEAAPLRQPEKAEKGS